MTTWDNVTETAAPMPERATVEQLRKEEMRRAIWAAAYGAAFADLITSIMVRGRIDPEDYERATNDARFIADQAADRGTR